MSKAILVKQDKEYRYWRIEIGPQTFWNIVPIDDATPPEGGYRSKSYIEHIKHRKF